MSYTINETRGTPAIPATRPKLLLEVDGAVIATATQTHGDTYETRLGTVPSLILERETVGALFKFVGELASPTKPATAILFSPEELDTAALGSEWTSTYNEGTYQRGQEGFEYRQKDGDEWYPLGKSGVHPAAFPLTSLKGV